jgi:transcriptional regulator with XRE-family HTH domain
VNKDVKKKIGQNIKALRLKKGLSQENLSLELDFDGSYIGKVENAKLNITVDKLILIADYFKVPVKNLFE